MVSFNSSCSTHLEQVKGAIAVDGTRTECVLLAWLRGREVRRGIDHKYIIIQSESFSDQIAT